MFKRIFGRKKRNLNTETLENSESSENIEWTPPTNNYENKIHLIVDDAKENRDIISRYLSRKGIDSEHAIDGLSALEKVSEKTYGCIWMDMNMTPMKGTDATQKMRENGYNGLIIGVTANVDFKSLRVCKKSGMNYVLPKPIQREVIYSILKEYNLSED